MRSLSQRYQDMKLGYKLCFQGFVLSIPLALLLWLYVDVSETEIHFAQDELIGSQYIEVLHRVQVTLTQYRFAISSQKRNYEDMVLYVSQAAQAVDKSIKELSAIDKQYRVFLQTDQRVDLIAQAWNRIRSNASTTNPPQQLESVTNLLQDLIGFIIFIGDTSKLILDPELDSFYLMDIVIMALPQLIEDVGAMHKLIFSFSGALNQTQQTELSVLIDRIEQGHAQVKRGLSTVYVKDSVGGMEQSLKPIALQLTEKLNSFTVLSSQVDDLSYFLSNSRVSYHRGSDLYAQLSKLYVSTNTSLAKVLVNRVNTLRTTQVKRLIFLAFCFMFSVVVAWVTITHTTRRVKSVLTAFNSIGSGDYSSVFTEYAEDEIGEIQQSLSRMQGKLKEYVEHIEKDAQEGARIRNALDSVDVGVLLVDDQGIVFYSNNTSRTLFRKLRRLTKIQGAPNNSDDLMGAQVSNLFDHQVELTYQRGPYELTVKLGRCVVDVVITPTLGKDKELRSYSIELTDVTQQSEIRNAVKEAVEKAAMGDLSVRLPNDSDTPFFRELAESLNQLLTLSECVINDTQRVFSALAIGDLRQKVESDYTGEFGVLKKDANQTVDQLALTLKGILSASHQVNLGVKEIAQGNKDLSTRTEQQASSLQETASSMEEMTGAVQAIRKRALEANAKSQQTRHKSEQGKKVVDAAISAMHNIDKASQEIVEIISVIDEIAFQTNLLALNAAVEAARAGDQGRGFAVVASEVRTLAQRSAEAAKEIKALIKDSVNKVKDGSSLVNASGEALDEIFLYAQEVSEMMGQLSQATQEQSEGIRQVNAAISEMDAGTQRNAALVEQTTATSATMSEIAGELIEQISVFKLANIEDISAGNDYSESSSSQHSTIFPVEPIIDSYSNKPSVNFNEESSFNEDDWEEF